MSEREADALVIFGITGDLARKQTFRSLYRLERRGLLDLPVLGVARQDLTDEDLRGRARDAIEQTGEDLDDEVFDRFAARLSYVSGDFDGDAAVLEGGQGARRPPQPGVLPRDPAVAVRHRGRGPGQSEPGVERAAGGRREAVRERSAVGPRARGGPAPLPRRVPDLPDRPLPREDGARGDPLPAVREHDARAGLEPQLPRLRADHDGRELRRRGSRPLLRSRRRPARRRRQPSAPAARDRGDGAARGRRSRHAQGRQGRGVQGDAGRRPVPLRARPVRRLPRHRRRRAGLDHRDVRRAPARDRQLALGGRAVLHPHGQAPGGQADRAPAAVQAPPARCTSSPPAAAGPSPTRSCSRSIRRPGSG